MRAAAIAWLAMSAYAHPAPQVALPPSQGSNGDWPLHNRDLYNSRFSPLADVAASNADRLALKWSFPAGVNIGEVTPLVLDGVMYVNSG